MKRAIEFHDSTLHSISLDGPDCVLQFRGAIVHESKEMPGGEGHDVFQQDIDFIFQNARVIQCPIKLPVWISDASLSITDKMYQNLVYLPLEGTGAVCLSGVTTEGENIRVEAERVVSAIKGEARFLERFSGEK